MIGIYKITSPTGKIYIGQSVCIYKRFRYYKKGYCKGQTILNRSLEKYGWENHIFDVVAECDVSELNILERYYQDLFNCIGFKGLNCRATKTSDKTGYFSDETKNKMSVSAKKRILTKDEINKRTKYLVASNISRSGIPKTQSEKMKISKSLSGRKNEHHTGFNHPFSLTVLNTETVIYYGSIAEASRSCKYTRTHLRAKIFGLNGLKKSTRFIIV